MEYGAFPANQFTGAKPFHRFPEKNEFFVRGERKRLNLHACLIALFGPWVLFCSVFAILSFSLHYYQPYITYILATVAFLVGVCVPAALAASALKRKVVNPAAYQPSWYVFLFGTCIVAFALGAMFGEENYSNNMRKYYSLQHLARYQDVDTNIALGQQLMDAGRIVFTPGTRLDIQHSMGFKNHDMYCVAPIKTFLNEPGLSNSHKGGDPNTYDFWAVGKGCCSGNQADFHCPHFNDRAFYGALRLMHDDDRPFYRLAVQQAEAMYKITATHPLFFEWVHDDVDAMNAFAQEGYSKFLLGIFSFFIYQAFIVTCTTLLFSRLMHYPSGISELSWPGLHGSNADNRGHGAHGGGHGGHGGHH